MRIISGSAKGTKLTAPEGFLTRPTPDMVRESLFNIMQDRVHGARFLDLFAGSGAVGLEALSRGADFAVFIDSRRQCVDKIRQNAAKTRLSDKARVLLMEADKAVRLLSAEGQAFDIIYLDPPYGAGLLSKSLGWIAELILVSQEGLVIAEHGNDFDCMRLAGYDVIRRKEYGNTVLHFLQRNH
ncbi:MAG: 16S rRNA (guanine(966)-N(2))-methyltransferase RsmD [Defluviitaleaceae bacterium]|nr:16S rRNA (guanine(966)-N(2))-methyltransferase RsmD [Defluviitaleaceae bacterium]MCL2835703.1 16S rRNA (guanine(966)-N(2))-methyltransferase RsmD [Defluviitaleaceae bacterium]